MSRSTAFRVGDPTRCGHPQRRGQGRQTLFCYKAPNHKDNHYHVALDGVKLVDGKWVYPTYG